MSIVSLIRRARGAERARAAAQDTRSPERCRERLSGVAAAALGASSLVRNRSGVQVRVEQHDQYQTFHIDCPADGVSLAWHHAPGGDRFDAFLVQGARRARVLVSCERGAILGRALAEDALSRLEAMAERLLNPPRTASFN
ncbi:hypothetical protein J2T57_001735 [Natronocella acetinitrilica]|uniref:Uncharacterized protein n=1 Tax=Natronocella acetinitrilica TaxID=414046 RepID=A0AAE3G3R2_9GAMM|nr:hypothetical protein [Natronocella acetinitrilica]MCP1674633.1 hypothetical protein [Natronocella acetinitrilica]